MPGGKRHIWSAASSLPNRDQRVSHRWITHQISGKLTSLICPFIQRGAGEVQYHGQATAGCLGQARRAPVGGDEAVYDREAEPGAAVLVAGDEPEERAGPLL